MLDVRIGVAGRLLKLEDEVTEPPLGSLFVESPSSSALISCLRGRALVAEGAGPADPVLSCGGTELVVEPTCSRTITTLFGDAPRGAISASSTRVPSSVGAASANSSRRVIGGDDFKELLCCSARVCRIDALELVAGTIGALADGAGIPK